MKSLCSFLLVLFVLGLASGCGLDARSVTEPIMVPCSPALQTYSQTSGVIGPNGGSLSTGGVTVTVPAQALSQSTSVGLAVTETDGTYSIALTPVGLGLAKSATVSAPCQTGNCGMQWLNPSTQGWEQLSTSTSPGRVQGKVIQFSDLLTDILE